jgi:Zn-dependent peptidase ImmA (M78 family)
MTYDRGSYQDKWRIERLAAGIRGRLGVDQIEPLDPWLLADAVPAHVFYPDDFDNPDLVHRLRYVNWDGCAFRCPDDPTLIVILNPARPRTRQVATLMEEFAHYLLNHQPSAIRPDPRSGLTSRTYTRADEHEAYDLGGAMLLPKERIQADVAAELSASRIATIHGCSEQLVTYRIKRMRLWKRYSAYAAPPAAPTR